MAELPSKLKRKTRNSSGSEAVSPDCKRICEVSDFLRFLGFPEATTTEEVASEVVNQFLERELELDGVRDIEFQRVHRNGKNW